MSSYNNQVKSLELFKTQVLKFIDELIDQFPKEDQFIVIRVFVKDQIPLTDVLGRFIQEVLPLHSIIENRDTDFFLNNDAIYRSLGDIGKNGVDKLKILWQSNYLDDDDREQIWNWMYLLIKISKKHYKNHGPVPGWNVDINDL